MSHDLSIVGRRALAILSDVVLSFLLDVEVDVDVEGCGVVEDVEACASSAIAC